MEATMNEILEAGLRRKLRFKAAGIVTIEDLYDLSPEKLNEMYLAERELQKQQSGTESLLDEPVEVNIEIDLRVEILRHITKLKVKERTDRKLAAVKREQKARILDLIAQKQDAALADKSIEELTKMVDEL